MVRIARQQRADTLRSIIAAENAARAAQATVETMREIDTRQAADFKASLEASQKAAEAADLSAIAAVRVELPALHIQSVRASTGGSAYFRDWSKNFLIEVNIKNYGRTPAFVTDIIVNPSVELVIPPNYKRSKTKSGDDVLPDQFVIDAGGEHKFTEYHYLNAASPFLSDNDISAILDDERNFYIYGLIRFLDFLDVSHTRGFIFLYVEKNEEFIPAYWRKEFYYQT